MRIFIYIFTFGFILKCNSLFAQNPPLLTVTLNGDIDQVNVGQAFQVNGIISLDANSTAISGGTPINYSVQITNKNGTIILQDTPAPNNAGLGPGGTIDVQSTFTMPWTQDDIWSAPGDVWTARLLVNSPGATILTPGNSHEDPFNLIIPDLSITVNSPTTARAGEYVNIEGEITNNTTAASESFVFFRVDANFPSSAGINSLLFPTQAMVDASVAWPVLPSVTLPFSIPNVYIPANTPDGPFQVDVFVDSQNRIIESDETAGSNQFQHTINIVSGTANIAATIFFNAEGTFQGLDPINLKLVARNSGDGPIVAGDTFTLRVALSQNNSFTQSNTSDDFILRQIELGGGNGDLGLGLRPDETITLDWVQLLPDNLEGDYYLVADLVANGIQRGNINQDNATPQISLRSQNEVHGGILSDSREDRSGRPSSNRDGSIVVFESFVDGHSQIILKNTKTNIEKQITTGLLEGQDPDGSSYAPKVSGDGRFVVFHSMASNLISGDNNNHPDIFLYDVFSEELQLISQSTTKTNANDGSFYPSIDEFGLNISFESTATNLTSSAGDGTKQIYLFKRSSVTSPGSIIQVTNGNGMSFDSCLSGDGSKLVFTSYASNLVTGESDLNNQSDVFLWDNNTFYYAGRNQLGLLPDGGKTQYPKISQDGTTVVFQSAASNMVSGKGISSIVIQDAGVGYTDTATIQILDATGSGAQVIPRVNIHGEINQLQIITPGSNYSNPSLMIFPDPTANAPTRLASATPLLVNPGGDLFRSLVSTIKAKGGSNRISESPQLNGEVGSRVGGNKVSREPSISDDGNIIAYSTQSSNLLDLNLTGTDLKVYPNHTYRPAQARAVLQGGIGKIEIVNPGSGYPANGNFIIQDLSGNGSGAVASFLADANGRIISITIQNSGNNYHLDQTIVSVANASGGTGFQAGGLKFANPTGAVQNKQGGASIHRIEMVDSGIGYPNASGQLMLKPSIIVDGDGADQDDDGRPDARIDPDRIHFGSNGEIFIEQHIELNVLDSDALLGSTLTIGDYTKQITIIFGSFASPPFTVNINQSEEQVRNSIIGIINQQWANPSNLSSGPQIENNATGLANFTLKAFTGRVTSSTPSALSVNILTNMLIQGNGFTRATPKISPSPMILGYSEISTTMTSVTSPGSRPVFNFEEDQVTDDIYVFNAQDQSNERASLNKFGHPANYITTTSMPSHRFPTLSGDGRYVFYSSDADGLGGLIFGNSNQDINNLTNNFRDIFYRDLKTNSSYQDWGQISIEESFFSSLGHEVNLNAEYPIFINGSVLRGAVDSVELYADGNLIGSSPVDYGGSQTTTMFFPWNNNRTGNHRLIAKLIDNLGNEYFSSPVDVNVKQNIGDVAETFLDIHPKLTSQRIYLRVPQFQQTTVLNLFTGETTVNSNLVGYNTEGPYTEDEIQAMLSAGSIDLRSLAYYEGQTPADAQGFANVYPFRTLIANASTLSCNAKFLGRTGKEPSLAKVMFYLNGEKISEQTSPPYHVSFSPPSVLKDGKTLLTRWALSVVAVDLQGNYSFNTKYGSNLHNEIFPTMTIDIVNGLSGLGENQILDGQIVTVNGIINGPSDLLEKVNDIHFLANGINFNSLQATDVNSSTNTIMRKEITTFFDIEFSKYAKPDGTVQLLALVEMDSVEGHVPVFISNTITFNIAPPIPWVDEQSNLLSLFTDLTARSPTSDEISYALESFDGSGNHSQQVASWINGISDMGAISDRIDIVAAHKVVFGSWHAEFSKFESDSNSYIGLSNDPYAGIFGGQATDPFWLKSYIDFLFLSNDYSFRFERVPYLVGSYYTSNIINFQNNRYDFIKRSFQNKWGVQPTLQQLYQASYKMLEWWGTFEPAYWELPTGTKPNLGVAFTGYNPDSPPRRDQIVPAPTYDVGNGGTINFRAGYNAGEVAVDFIYNMAKEVRFDTMPYILSTDDIRDTHFKIATLMHLLWRENADILKDEDVEPYSKLSTIDAISKILNDRRYTSRFNLIWENSISLGKEFPNWKQESWFGNFWDFNFPWVYHRDFDDKLGLGWIYIAGVSPSNFWFYSNTLGWVWTKSSIYPYLYSASENGWIYFESGENSASYYSFQSNSWKSY